MEDEDDDAMEDFAQGADRVSDSEDGKFLTGLYYYLFRMNYSVLALACQV